MRKFAQKQDFFWIFLIICLAALLLWLGMKGSETQNLRAEILQEGQSIKSVSLAENGIFSVEETPQVIFEIKNGQIRFKESNCPDQICVKSGFLHKHGQTAACLPNGLVLKISGSALDDEIIMP